MIWLNWSNQWTIFFEPVHWNEPILSNDSDFPTLCLMHKRACCKFESLPCVCFRVLVACISLSCVFVANYSLLNILDCGNICSVYSIPQWNVLEQLRMYCVMKMVSPANRTIQLLGQVLSTDPTELKYLHLIWLCKLLLEKVSCCAYFFLYIFVVIL